ncbi:MAG: trimeric intracellular cation channel family protein [Saprospiraceae bacterium]|nr:trimeric intracellular cation channel family protein [Saprospiraceae bacterium]
MNLITLIDFTGTFVFAISGMLIAIDKKFDLFGVIILGVVTAIGGGTLRDVLIGSTPVSWMQNETYFYIILSGLPICYFFNTSIHSLRKGIFLFDTLGIGLFTILGLKKTLEFGLSPSIAITMGIVSAVFGGVIRDVLANEIPLIFRKEIYAFACLFGAIVYLATRLILPEPIAMLISILSVILIRILSIKRNWTLAFHPH